MSRTGVTLHWLVLPTIVYVRSSRRVSEWMDTGQALQCWYHYDFDTMRYDDHSGPFCTHSLAHHWCNCLPQSPPQAPSALRDWSTPGNVRRSHGRCAWRATSIRRRCRCCGMWAAHAWETCVRARYRTIYGRHDIVRSMNPRLISRYRVIEMITTVNAFDFRSLDMRSLKKVVKQPAMGN